MPLCKPARVCLVDLFEGQLTEAKDKSPVIIRPEDKSPAVPVPNKPYGFCGR